MDELNNILDNMQAQLDAENEDKRKAEEEKRKAEEEKRKAEEEKRKADERYHELYPQFIPAVEANDIEKVKECIAVGVGRRYDYYVCSDHSSYRKMAHCPSTEMAKILIEDRLSVAWGFEEKHGLDSNRKQFIYDVISCAIKDNPDRAEDYVQILRDYKAIDGFKTSDAEVYPIAVAHGCDKQCFDFQSVVHEYYKAKNGYRYVYGPYGDYTGFMPSDFKLAKKLKKDLKSVLANGYRPDTTDQSSESYLFMKELLKEREVERYGGVICSYDKHGELHGDYEVYDNGNLIKKCIYEHGKLHGDYEERDASGITKKCTYKDDKLHGDYEERDASGITKKCTYKDDKLNGDYEKCDVLGNVIKAQYKDDKLNGVYKEINNRGEIVVEKYYENGVDVTKKHEALKRIASKRIKKEKQIEDKTGKHVILPKAKPMEKLFAKIAVKKNKEI